MLATEGLAVTGHVFRKAIPETFFSSSYNHRTSARAEKPQNQGKGWKITLSHAPPAHKVWAVLASR